VIRVKLPAAVLVLVTALAVGGAAAARNPTPTQKAAITAALQSEQGDVAIQAITISTAKPGYASLNWGFANGGFSSQNNSLLMLAGKSWKVLWTRESEQPADGACVYVPAPVAHDLLHVSCPPAASLHARAATSAELTLIRSGFLKSNVTPYAKTSTGLTRTCISNVDHSWAGGVAGFQSGSSVYVFFRHTKGWTPVFESLLQQGPRPPAAVLLSLASCVGYNPADYNA
jgi:hypothetical protein